jgi:hypothetical protein
MMIDLLAFLSNRFTIIGLSLFVVHQNFLPQSKVIAWLGIPLAAFTFLICVYLIIKHKSQVNKIKYELLFTISRLLSNLLILFYYYYKMKN